MTFKPYAAGWLCALLCGLMLSMATAVPAQARWLKAESERFIVYSDGNERDLRAYTQKLESYDRLLRARMGLDENEAPLRKLPIYLVSSKRDLRQISPDLPDFVGGFYRASDEDIYGVAMRGAHVGDDLLLHEYAHHFMAENFTYPYPGWFIEGFAEYYMTAEFRSDRVLFGKHNDNRAYWLFNASWLPMETLLSQRPLQLTRRDNSYYPLAWLLTHWFLSDAERMQQLDAYLRDVGSGTDSVEAMTRATGLTPAELRQTLQRYMRGRITYSAWLRTFPTVDITVTVMPASADDLLLLNQRLKSGVADDQRAATAAEVRRVAAAHGDDPLALLALGHADLHFGERSAAEAPLQRLLEIDPAHVEGLQYMARLKIDMARDARESAEHFRLMNEASAHLRAAYAADDASYQTYLLLAETRRSSSSYPNENDIATLRLAYGLAPQLARTRIALAEALIQTGKTEEAITLLEFLANDPHGRGGATHARQMLNNLRGVSENQVEAEDDAETPDDDASGERQSLDEAA